MKLAFDYKKVHIRLVFGIGFALYFMGKCLKKYCPETDVKPLIKEIKRSLKIYKREHGALNLVEVISDETRILIKL